MSWGTYWMYYSCPSCGKKFCWDLGYVTAEKFGQCPVCGQIGVLDGESKDLPSAPLDYEDCTEY